MDQHPIINEEDHESSKVTEESGGAVVVEESKLSTSEIESVQPTDMTARNFTIHQPESLCNENTNFEFNVFLYTKYQDTLEMADKLGKAPADETKPFEFKYQARDLLQNLLKSDIERFEKSPLFKEKIRKNEEQSNQKEEAKESVSHLNQDFDLVNLTIIKGQIHYLIAVNMFESEEYSDSEKYLKVSLEYINSLPREKKISYCNIIQDIYNHLGIIHCNRDNHPKGLPYFAKAEQIYELVKCIKLPCPQVRNNLREFLRESNSESTTPSKSDAYGFNTHSVHAFYIDGGIDRVQVERNYTLTLFYLAQVYTKLQKSEKAVGYCAQTVKRQLETNEYEVKDWSTNCVNLSEYFIENNHFSQAEYCLFAAISILPPPNQVEEDQELRAMLQAQIGRYYLHRLRFGIDLHKKGASIGLEGPLYDTVHRKFIEFPSLNLKWPEITDVNDIEQAKFFFRLGNTQFK